MRRLYLTPTLLLVFFVALVIFMGPLNPSNDRLSIVEVFRARDELTSTHFSEPDSGDLLMAAWLGARDRAEEGGVNLSPLPQSAYRPDDADRDFSKAFQRLVRLSRGTVREEMLLEQAISSMRASLADVQSPPSSPRQDIEVDIVTDDPKEAEGVETRPEPSAPERLGEEPGSGGPPASEDSSD